MDILFKILLLALLGGICYAYFRYPAFRTAVSRGWSEWLTHLSGDAQRKKARAANTKTIAANDSHTQPSGHTGSQGKAKSPAASGSQTYNKVLDKIVVLKNENSALKQCINTQQQDIARLRNDIAHLQQRLNACERQQKQLSAALSAPAPISQQPQPAAQHTVSGAPLLPGHTYYAIRPSSVNPSGFRNEDWSPDRPSHTIYCLTVEANGKEAEFTLDPMGLPEVLNAVAFYKDTVSYLPVVPTPKTYVPVPGHLRYVGGIWQVITPIQLEGRA